MDPYLPKIYVNYEEIKQAFLNIVRNAFEAMPEGGQLTIKAIPQSDSSKCIEITFTDTGIGMKKENLSKLFNPFFTTKLRGTGLGLAICHRIINERHGGKIHIESEENKGTTIKVELPIGRPLGETLGVK
jgi:signal transduction histidine kinase